LRKSPQFFTVVNSNPIKNFKEYGVSGNTAKEFFEFGTKPDFWNGFQNTQKYIESFLADMRHAIFFFKFGALKINIYDSKKKKKLLL
jgi:hypothetical protein